MNPSSLFNSPVEIGLRVLSLLADVYPLALDLQRLVILDYILVHSGDIAGGPESLHPPNPLRGGEVSIRRGLVAKSLHLLATRGLIRRIAGPDGIAYVADDTAPILLDAVSSRHGRALISRAGWAVEIGAKLSDVQAAELLETTVGKWRTEFLIDESEYDV